MTAKQALKAVPLWAKVVAVALTLLAAGATVRAEWLDMPAELDATVKRVDAVEGRVDVLERADLQRDVQYERIICLLTLTEESRARINNQPLAVEEVCRR